MKMRENVLLASLTTIGLGGKARYFVSCESVEELKEALLYARERDLPVHILGGGSNTVFADGGFDGLVVQINLKGVDFKDNGVVEAAAGERWDNLVEQCVERGLAGIECLSGMPGLVGATPVQNVGAYGQQVADVITKVKTLDRQTLEVVSFANKQCQFSYRHSRFKGQDKGRYIIIRVTYKLQLGGAPNLSYPELVEAVGDNMNLRAVRQAVIALRQRKSMVVSKDDENSRSCGSFFVNPLISREELKKLQGKYEVPYFESGKDVKIPAGWLVEQAGFKKGWRRGRVGISPNHALALVNYGGTAGELLKLAEDIQAAVKKKFGIVLEREPVVVS